jgi:hypothetical protein
MLDVTVFLRVSFEMPSSLPCFHDLMMKNIDCAVMNAITPNATAYIAGLALKSAK